MATIVQQLEAEDNLVTPYDASDEKSVTDARKKEGRKKAKEREDYISLMDHENGRRFLWSFCAAAVVGNPVVAGDLHSTYFNLGQERKARELFIELLRVCPKLVASMIEENMEKK